MSDFTPETRNSAIWSGDSRKVANGKANEVILTKQGKMAIPDLSDIEAVQMGHVMEPVIGRLAQAKLGVELTKIEESLTHAKHPWFKSHFDFAGKQGGKSFLVEAKNYNAATRNKFDIAGICPPADMAQLVHEAAVYGVVTRTSVNQIAEVLVFKKIGFVAIGINDNPGHARFPPTTDQQHLEQSHPTASLSAGNHADLRALVCCLPLKPAPCRRNDARARRFRRPLQRASLGHQNSSGEGCSLSSVQAICWWELEDG